MHGYLNVKYKIIFAHIVHVMTIYSPKNLEIRPDPVQNM